MLEGGDSVPEDFLVPKRQLRSANDGHRNRALLKASLTIGYLTQKFRVLPAQVMTLGTLVYAVTGPVRIYEVEDLMLNQRR